MTPLLDVNGAIVENGLVEQALGFVRRNTSGTAVLEGGRRVEKPAYPQEVLREGIVNALIHRDYLLSSTDVELGVYSDRLGNHFTRQAAQWDYASTDARRNAGVPKSDLEGDHARLWLFGAHGDGHSTKDYRRDAEAQQHNA